MNAESGQMLSHYRLVEKIGEGGMGVVWKAEDTVLKRSVAIKVLPANSTITEDQRRMFLQEARLAASLSHGNIVQVHELGQDRGLDFIVMEFIEGQSLAQLLQGRALRPEQVADWGSQVAQGVARAHRKNLLHRDLKPANILITERGEAKVVDFGLAVFFSGTDESTLTLALSKTAIAQQDSYPIAGTVPYMSPEQVRGERLDARSDIFSLGSILYEMTTGERPFVGPTTAQVAQAIVDGRPRPIHERVPGVPFGLVRIIEKLLSKNPADRYQGLDDVEVDLKRLSRELDSGSSPSYEDVHSTTVATPRRRMPAVVLLLTAALLVLAGWWTLGRTPSTPPPDATVANERSLAVFWFENLKDPADPERLGQILQELVITDLSGLDSLHVLSSQRLFDLRRQVSEAPDSPSRDTNTLVALKAGAGNMLTGSLSQLGETWIVAAQMVDVGTGEVVQSSRIDGTDLYAMVDELTTELRAGLELGRPAEDLSISTQTSRSLTAYRLYLEGNELLYIDPREAGVRFRQAIEIDPEFGKAYYKLAVALAWFEETRAQAKPVLDEFLARGLYTSDKEKRMAEAARAARELRFGESIPALRQLAAEFPDEKDIWYELGESLFHSPGGEHIDQAMQAFDRAVELDPYFLLPYSHIFNYLYSRKQYARALEDSRRLSRRFPEIHELRRKRIYYSIRTGNEAEAVIAFDEALEAASHMEDRMWTYDRAGRGYRDVGDYDRSLAYYEQALASAPNPDRRAYIARQIEAVKKDQERSEELQR